MPFEGNIELLVRNPIYFVITIASECIVSRQLDLFLMVTLSCDARTKPDGSELSRRITCLQHYLIKLYRVIHQFRPDSSTSGFELDSVFTAISNSFQAKSRSKL